MGSRPGAGALVPHSGMTSNEEIAFAKIKRFCTGVLKILAPPLLREVESSTKLCPDAEPFTPVRITRSSGSRPPVAKPPKKATVAETGLLKALGITPADLTVDEAALHELRGMFDSPLREQHLRAIAAIFGKVVPLDFASGGLEAGTVLVQ